jgi:hypothetical protein
VSSGGDQAKENTERSTLNAHHATARRLTRIEEDELLEMLRLGAAPGAACQRLGLSLDALAAHWAEDEAFRQRVGHTRESLSQNVAAALYRTAMEGSVSAQTFYLKHLPPPEWPQPNAGGEGDEFDRMSDEELLEFCRTHGIALPEPSLDPGGDDAFPPQTGTVPEVPPA